MEAVERANRTAKKQWGGLAYILAGIQQLNRQELFEAEIEIADEVSHVRVGAIAIANVAPPTSALAQGLGQIVPDDGILRAIEDVAESVAKVC
ncbi:hypothetical protein [Altericista sp. CCNU0014]|uniref:hypothetical protein n=1 Tax=Altericista sp. CCNU0014 TaxID=3082949 RepID=UPI00385073D2